MPYADPARAREAARARYARRRGDPEFMERRREQQRASYAKHREQYLPLKRRRALKARYGLTEAELGKLEQQAGGCCELCGQPTQHLCIDHDHETGRVRGLLCPGCNAGLHWAERPEWYADAATYLERNRDA